MCQRSSYPFYIVSYCLKWVTTSWTYSISHPTPSEIVAQNPVRPKMSDTFKLRNKSTVYALYFPDKTLMAPRTVEKRIKKNPSDYSLYRYSPRDVVQLYNI